MPRTDLRAVRARWYVLLWVGITVLLGGCSRKALGVLVGLPPGEEEEQSGAAQPVTASAQGIPQLSPEFFVQPEDTVTPAIELTLDPDSVVSLLPRDHAGNVDWMEALRQGIIRPRDGIDGPRDWDDGGFEFAFDFYLAGPTEVLDALFPHSAHTELMECAQCHPRIFKSPGTDIKMADVLAGRYCGECHGKVAFPTVTGCERCHTTLAQPANRAQPVLLGTVQMRRATEILAEGDSTATVEGNATGVRTDGFARAQFPHWVHRIRFRCTTCHMSIFEPEAGTNSVTMVDIEQGRFCGECHNGDIAFLPEMTNCDRCHVPASQPSSSPAPAAP